VKTDTRQGRTAAVLFTDLVGSTELLTHLGEVGFDKLRRAHFTCLREAINRAGGTEVKTLGDGVLAVFGAAADAVDCAVAMQREVDLAIAPPEGERLDNSLGDGLAVHPPPAERCQPPFPGRPGPDVETQAIYDTTVPTRTGCENPLYRIKSTGALPPLRSSTAQ
jgi:hypothetical protein